MAEKIFAQGIIYKEPSDKAPDFVVGGLSVKKSEFIPFLQNCDGDWVNLKINIGKSGKPYVELDTWKPNKREEPEEEIPSTQSEPKLPETNDDLPF
jgi:hypothetical protein